MIGGIFETIGKTLGVGKEKYFLELDDAAEESGEAVKASVTGAVQTVAKTAKEASKEVTQKAKETVAEATDKTKGVIEEVSDKAQSAAPVETNKKTKKAPKKKAAKGKKTAAKKNDAAPETVAEVPQPAAPAKPSAEDLIVAAIAAESKGQQLDGDGNVVSGPQNFATDYLLTPIRTRRRMPGPSLSGFKGMAKDVNPRLKG